MAAFDPNPLSPTMERHLLLVALLLHALLPGEDLPVYTRGLRALYSRFFAEKTVPTQEEFQQRTVRLLELLRDASLAADDDDGQQRLLVAAGYLKRAHALAPKELRSG